MTRFNNIEIKNKVDHMKYFDNMEVLNSDIQANTLQEMYINREYTEQDVLNALKHDICTPYDFGALLSPMAKPYLEQMAVIARDKTRRHFGNSISMFTPIYISNYCESYCVYCGFNCHNKIKRAKLTLEQIEQEMIEIAKTGLREILILTGESRRGSSVEYIGQAVSLAKKYFTIIGLEVYPMNSDEYAYLHKCGADYVSVYQETYNSNEYEKLHLEGEKRIFPYRFDSQERAIMGGMRGVAFGALLGLCDFRKDALATGLHAYYLQRKYPHAEISFSCPRLRPIINNSEISPLDVYEAELLQVIMAYRIFMPFAGISISTRENAKFRDNAIAICATKISAGVSVGIGERTSDNAGDEQFEISDERTVDEIFDTIKNQGLQPVMSDYIYV